MLSDFLPRPVSQGWGFPNSLLNGVRLCLGVFTTSLEQSVCAAWEPKGALESAGKVYTVLGMTSLRTHPRPQ